MIKYKTYFVVLTVSFFLVTQAWANGLQLTIVKVPNDHLSTVDSSNYTINAGYFFDVAETYSEDRQLIPYVSHDGFALVSPQGDFFDKIVGWNNSAVLNLQFDVVNNTGYIWSDYHFEFWTPDFTQPINASILSPNSDIFDNSQIVPNGINFFAPSEVAAGQHVNMSFQLDLTSLPGHSVGLRQVATTVPEPASMLLFGAGLIGLARLRKRKKEEVWNR